MDDKATHEPPRTIAEDGLVPPVEEPQVSFVCRLPRVPIITIEDTPGEDQHGSAQV
jgi:hypothetical protein